MSDAKERAWPFSELGKLREQITQLTRALESTKKNFADFERNVYLEKIHPLEDRVEELTREKEQLQQRVSELESLAGDLRLGQGRLLAQLGVHGLTSLPTHPHTVSHDEQQAEQSDPCDICGIPRHSHSKLGETK